MTNNVRIYLWIALAIVLWLNYNRWVQDYSARPGSEPRHRHSYLRTRRIFEGEGRSNAGSSREY